MVFKVLFVLTSTIISYTFKTTILKLMSGFGAFPNVWMAKFKFITIYSSPSCAHFQIFFLIWDFWPISGSFQTPFLVWMLWIQKRKVSLGGCFGWRTGCLRLLLLWGCSVAHDRWHMTSQRVQLCFQSIYFHIINLSQSWPLVVQGSCSLAVDKWTFWHHTLSQFRAVATGLGRPRWWVFWEEWPFISSGADY